MYLVKTLHRDSYSFLSNILSCKEFLYNLSKDLIVCWSLSNSFSYLLYLFMTNLCHTLSPNDRVQAIPADIGKIIEPTPVIDKVIEVDVAPMMTIESIDSNIVFRVFFVPLF